jgi:hypothetical protein
MTTTTTYITVEKNLANYKKVEAQKPAVKNATAYYQANIGNVKTIAQFVGNYRLLSYALQAYGLGDQVNNKALITKVLQEGTSSPKALANTLGNSAWKAFANAFNFSATGSAAPSSSASVSTTTSDYIEQQLETDQGKSDPGVELALYFQRVAPTLTDSYQILADKNLTQVAQTIFNLPAGTSAAQIDKEAAALKTLMPLSQLQNPAKLTSLVERFTAAYDADYGPGGADAGSSLTVSNGNASSSTVSAASSILSGALTGMSSYIGGTASNFASLLSSLALGG